jgi:hypothetical protein
MEPKIVLKFRGSRKYVRGITILLWKVRVSRTTMRLAKTQLKISVFGFWKSTRLAKDFAAHEIWKLMLIFTVAYKRGLRAQSWGSNF